MAALTGATAVVCLALAAVATSLTWIAVRLARPRHQTKES